MAKPIRVFYSQLTGEFYATRSYKEYPGGGVKITGQKDNVTQDIARAIVAYGVEFTPKEKAQEGESDAD